MIYLSFIKLIIINKNTNVLVTLFLKYYIYLQFIFQLFFYLSSFSFKPLSIDVFIIIYLMLIWPYISCH